MAKEQNGAEGAPPAAGPSKGPLILILVNSVAVMAAVGALVYTQIIYKRPVITEMGERDRLEKVHASPTPLAIPGMMSFDPVTVNIEANPAKPKAADGTPQQIQGKLHYATVGFALELRDIERKPQVESIKAVLMDRLLTILGHKTFQELTTVQGRYVLRTEILDAVNGLVKQETKAKDSAAINVYFTQFIVQ